MNAQLSQTDKLFRDTLIHRAEGDALTWLSQLYGVPKPKDWDEDSWRSALHAVALGVRGNPGTTFAFLDRAWSHLHEKVQININATFNTRIYAVAGAGTFDMSYVGRLVRINGVIHYVSGPSDMSVSAGEWLELAPVTTALWKKARWTENALDQEAEFLTFSLVEGCDTGYTPSGAGTVVLKNKPIEKKLKFNCKVFVNIMSSETEAPAAYLREEPVYLLYNSETAPFTLGATLTGGTSGATAEIREVFDNGTEGYLQLGPVTDGPILSGEPITDSEGGAATSNGNAGIGLQKYVNEVAGGFAVGNIVDGSASGASGRVNGVQTYGTTGWLVLGSMEGQFRDADLLSVSSVLKGEANGNTLMLEPAYGQPEGGIMLDDASTDGNQSTGPFPAYLYADAGGAIVDTLNLLLVSGCHAVGRSPG